MAVFRWPEFTHSNPARKSVGNNGIKPKLGAIEDELFAWIQKQRADRLSVARPMIQFEALRLVDASALSEAFKQCAMLLVYLL